MEGFFKAVILENDQEALLLDSILNERDVPHEIKSYHDTAFNGLYQTQKGWGHVSAPRAYHEEIIEIIADLRKETSKNYV